MRALPLRAQGVEGVIEARAKPAGLVGITDEALAQSAAQYKALLAE